MSKSLINKEECVYDLKLKIRAEVKRDIKALGLWGVILGLLALVLFLITKITIIKPKVVTIPVVLYGIVFIYFLYRMYRAYRKAHRVQNREFFVTEAELTCQPRVEQNWDYYASILRQSRFGDPVQAMYFSSYGKYIIDRHSMIRADKIALEYAVQGDMFYLVILERDPRRPALVYNQKPLEWDEFEPSSEQ